MTKTQQIQAILGVTADDIWGPKSQDALNLEIQATENRSGNIAKIQAILGTKQDGQWGPISQGALNELLGAKEFHCEASSFADPQDVMAFKKCKLTGKSDVACFDVGDNGIGQFGKTTAQDHTPMIAVSGPEMVKRWGSVFSAAHRPVSVTVNGKTITATVEDRISAPGRIDLNPACAKLLGLNPPFLVPCSWKWL